MENSGDHDAAPPQPLTTTSSAASTKKVFLSNGRYPWYKADGQLIQPYLIAIGGGSASGKTSVSQRIIRQLGVPWVVLISMDSFYKCLSTEEKAQAAKNEFNFDHPSSFEFDLVYDTLSKLKKGVKVDVPIYDFVTHSRAPKSNTVYGANVIIFEGIFALFDKSVRDLMDLKIFVDTDADVRLARRLKRDIAERGRDLQGVLSQYNRFVKPAFDEFIYPTMRFADVIVPRGSDNTVAIDLISTHISRQLIDRGISFRYQLAHGVDADTSGQIPDTVHPMKMTNELKAIHTIIRDRNTQRHDFVFFAERLSRLVVEKGLTLLPFTKKVITTPTENTFEGLAQSRKICSVSIVRAGVTMESALRSVVKDIPIGKILIQTDPGTGEPMLHFCKLPIDIAERWVLLTDATIATGAAALMAIRVLLDHNVPESNIIFLTLISAPQGLHAISHAFPKVRIVTSEIDQTVDDRFYLVPGFGNFGDRYFGTE